MVGVLPITSNRSKSLYNLEAFVIPSKKELTGGDSTLGLLCFLFVGVALVVPIFGACSSLLPPAANKLAVELFVLTVDIVLPKKCPPPYATNMIFKYASN